MMLSPSKKNTGIFISAIIATMAICFFSCQKQLTGEASDFTPAPPNLSATVSSSVSGFVTDENDVVVSGATITVGSTNMVTDKYGFFEIKNVQVVKEAAVVTVAQSGYFKGIKTYLAEEGKSAFFRIKLLPKTNAGNIDAAAGGKVILTNGLSISIPANAVINAVTNAAYTGQVNVAAQWIDPTAADLNRTMPGDLRGLDTAGSIKMLTTYGMSAVELTGAGGELLQIATGKKASLTMPLPFAVTAGAPSTIPLWYFDEALGLWKEQGMAVKTGNSYVGDVSHFSYWNCDVASNYAKFNCTIVDPKGNPIQNAQVKISYVSNPRWAGYGYTDSTGYTGGIVPPNKQLLLQVFSDHNCSTVLYSQNFSTATSLVALGKITVSTATVNIATITGKLVNCSNAPVTNGYVLMTKDGINYRYGVDTAGAFNFSTSFCSNNTVVTFIAVDKNGSQSGKPFTDTLLAGANTIGSITACGTTILEFINYSINGTSYSLGASGDTLYNQADTQNIGVYGYSNYGANSGNSVNMTFTKSGIPMYSTQTLNSFSCRQILDSTLIKNPIKVSITEYGAVGQFIAGNFTGTLTGAPPANKPYNVTCTFRIMRRQ